MKKQNRILGAADIDEKIIQKYLLNNCSKKERELVENWITSKPDDKDLNQLLYQYWNEIDLDLPGLELDTERIIKETTQIIDKEKPSQKTIHLPFYRTAKIKFSRIAAVIIIGFLIIGGLYISVNKVISPGTENNIALKILTSPNDRIHFELPDGTVGWLNTGSTLEYPEYFDNQERRVTLTGEAYFDVKADPDNIFVVEIPDMEVMVLGTKFNISAYLEDDITEVVLETGNVVVDKKADSKRSSTIEELQPGQKLTFHKETDVLDIIKVDVPEYTAWTEGKLIFRDEPMGKLVNRIGRWYNVDIVLGNEELETYQFRGSFTNESLEVMLDILKQTSPIAYLENEREVLTDGTFGRRRITILLDQ